MNFNPNLVKENLRIALNSIRSNLLRTILTVMIIAVGIMALIGILTSVDAIKNTINSEFTRMGANSFTIRNQEMKVHIGKRRERRKNYTAITYRQAKEFQDKYQFPSLVSISIRASGNATVKYHKVKTNPNIPVVGGDENYLNTSGYDVELGRNFSEQEVQTGKNVTIIGSELAETLFKKQKAEGKIISVGASHYKIIGVLKSKGSSMGFSDDKVVIIPLTNARQNYTGNDASYTISVMPSPGSSTDFAVGEAENTFRIVRKLGYADDSDFDISKSDNLANMLIENIQYVTLAATIIGIITLFGAAVGLMNIMLVSVSERIREIGTRKAIGATSKIIRQQFLFESVLIGQLGGILGIILGILVGNMVSAAVGNHFFIPWLWILFGVLICFIVGILSGLLPAIKASKSDPIEALRFE
jgi:putative ABC transport system permease protein